MAVTWTATTTFTQQVTIAAGSISAGDCVTVVGASGSSPSADSFTADLVTVTKATNGSCDGGFGGGGFGGAGGNGTRPSGAPTNLPTGSRTRSPSTGSGSGRAAGPSQVAFASGSVVSASGSDIVVASRTFPGRGGSTSSSPTATTANKTITLDASSKITEEQPATASAVQVGLCATAQGSADSSGAVTARSIALTPAVNGTCAVGGRFGGGRFGGGGFAAGATGSPSA